MAGSLPPLPVVGLYGISGSGKTTLAKALKGLQDLMGTDYTTTPQAPPVPLQVKPYSFREGSELIDSNVPGGLAAFKQLGAAEKEQWRESIIRDVAKHAQLSREPVVVTGHYMFPVEAKDDDDDEAQPPSPSNLLSSLQSVHTKADWESYTHIIYLTVPPETITARCSGDATRARAPLGADALGAWQEAEKRELRRRCREHGVVFTVVDGLRGDLPGRVRVLLEFIRRSECKLDIMGVTGPIGRHPCMKYEKTIPGLYRSHVRVLAFDADRTLSAQDSGGLFWELVAAPVGMAPNDGGGGEQVPVLKQVFGGPLGYSRRAFVQATLLYEEAVEALGGDDDDDDDDNEWFESLCASVASRVEMRPEFLSLLQRAVDDPLVVPLVITCGLRRIWELVLMREGFRPGGTFVDGGEAESETAHVVRLVGAERVEALQPVVDPEHKAEVVRWLAGEAHLGGIVPSRGVGSNICAFGDSAVDIPMLKTAHRAFVVVDRDRQGGAMSKQMEEEIGRYAQPGVLDMVSPGVYCDCANESSFLYRVELPPSKTHGPVTGLSEEQHQQPQLSLPVASLTDPETLSLIFPPHTPETTALRPTVPVHHSTTWAAANLLSTPMRDAGTSGRELQRAHRAAGKYLSMQLLPEVLGLERFAIPHVCKDADADAGNEPARTTTTTTDGYRLPHGDRTLIVALMRGGDPMAQGVFDMLPGATYLHARGPGDVQAKHLHGVVCVLLVDSVVNSGASMLEFVHAIRGLHGTVRIVVVAGVVQANAVEVREEMPAGESGMSGMSGMVEPGLEEPSMRERLAEYGNVQMVALRISTNKFKGVGGTDTGNRLFNTTHLDDC
ncbi:hypothetical protein GGTG_10948 [Gaeumannomyces tritici R3-111a-1]|uniref:Phosphoribosyltransferase domain-containing protein n=1 Tax=Gaeumannomyces tritici (strain R3-111a-1) TaxID=644352 RepID=J3PBS7_GAET3|nr:hypothetical protein GGTG_10948 [Gaeumannomyces tritici R3-111a-1]EJT71694.1 hypothetical protein GGTG_10948 [Gaeumannomyces tritici R3-111a-1]